MPGLAGIVPIVVFSIIVAWGGSADTDRKNQSSKRY